MLYLLDGHKTHYKSHVCQEAKKCEVIIPPILRMHPSPWIRACSSHQKQSGKATHMFQSKNPGYKSQNIIIKRGMGERYAFKQYLRRL